MILEAQSVPKMSFELVAGEHKFSGMKRRIVLQGITRCVTLFPLHSSTTVVKLGAHVSLGHRTRQFLNDLIIMSGNYQSMLETVFFGFHLTVLDLRYAVTDRGLPTYLPAALPNHAGFLTEGRCPESGSQR